VQISRAIKWIRNHDAEAVRIGDLADVVSMSVTSLHRGFLALTSLSPMQYQKRIRLQEARSRLLSRSQDVAAVGFSVGYESPSQFSREYKRLFGTPPGKDGERLRSIHEFEPDLARTT
jgi:transcriptional regulator GlxA family with amidase domain